jgi:hypothetical protein
MCESGFNVLDIEDWFSDCPRPDKEELEELLREAQEDNEKIHLMIKDLTNTPPSDTIAQEVV